MKEREIPETEKFDFFSHFVKNISMNEDEVNQSNLQRRN